jgi:hypothetical protein
LLEFVKDPCCFLSLADVERNASGSQHFEGFGADLEALLDASREDDCRRSVVEEFLDVRGLNAWDMTSPGFIPVPFSRAAGKQLRVLERTPVLDFQVTPRDVRNAR